ncbi:carbohydrate esterase family 4 protein [Mixia osmundae IAM 14324]|uniref:chitin deacetylase n=1 Tax=Mixia osmundae (strain CBS 9802 / IAM 14324 / JCM 22182 / KY 12970) TaxID=764103 RepID=G7E9H0_MIXOS|nr:carbohydrate esterase family 4 protein [Mixia osmundae IAM 14324]KEI39922.1 carbohydrate esterase family 4 protein [Mixia osmundae IAM 14324]GAA99289.1 hypothetical protein E5Q_05984 [Mixia osmundae IAM 14324]
MAHSIHSFGLTALLLSAHCISSTSALIASPVSSDQLSLAQAHAAPPASRLSRKARHAHIGQSIGTGQSDSEQYYMAKLRARHPLVSAAVLQPMPALHKRQHATTTKRKKSAKTSAASSAAAVPSATSGTASGSTTVLVAATGTTVALQGTLPTAGATPTGLGSNAPALPAVTIVPSQWPALDVLPSLNSTQVQGWLAEIDFTKVPNIAPNGIGGCANTSYNAQAIANAGSSGNCWWTCGGCTRAEDETACDNKGDWGLSYDDGPSPYTPKLLNFLDANKIKSTFFVVGSRAISRPELLQYEHMDSHQLSVHTWSHPPLTTLSNEGIVAELGWSRQAIKEITGVSPNTMRPPYGDIDDRVRAIASQMGMTPIIWTTADGHDFDTEDWQIGVNGITEQTVANNFRNIISAAGSLTDGFIVLEHDLYPTAVDLAVNIVLPEAMNASLSMQPIVQCLGGTLADAYIETASNTTTSSSTSSGTTSGAAASASSASDNFKGVTKSGDASSHTQPTKLMLASVALFLAAFA